MTIFGYFVTWTDYTDGTSHKDYGLVAAESRADAIVDVEKMYEGDWASVEEIGISSLNPEDDNSPILDQNQIDFFIDAMRQNGYGEEGN